MRGQPPAPEKPAQMKKPARTAGPPVLASRAYPLPADLVKELAKEAVSRKLDRTAWSQQDIVAVAIRDWSRKACKQQKSVPSCYEARAAQKKPRCWNLAPKQFGADTRRRVTGGNLRFDFPRVFP